MQINSSYPVISTDKLQKSVEYYVKNFGFTTTFISDWYISLKTKHIPTFELALLDYRHPSIPENYRIKTQGLLINFEVEDAEKEYKRLTSRGIPMLLQLTIEEWGQKHCITVDPNGVLIDIIENTAPSNDFQNSYTD